MSVVSFQNFRTMSSRRVIKKTICGLHVLHGSLQTGHSTANWNVNSILEVCIINLNSD